MTKTICDRCDREIEDHGHDPILPIMRLRQVAGVWASDRDIVDTLRRDLCNDCYEHLATAIAKVLAGV